MPDCAPADITIGGVLTPRTRIALANALDEPYGEDYGEGLTLIDAAIESGATLDHGEDEASYGSFESLEAACQNLGLKYRRATTSSAWISAEVVFFDGESETSFEGDDDGKILVPLAEVIVQFEAGTLADWLKPQKSAQITIPPLTYDGPPGERGAYCQECDEIIIPLAAGGWEHYETGKKKHTAVPDEEAA